MTRSEGRNLTCLKHVLKCPFEILIVFIFFLEVVRVLEGIQERLFGWFELGCVVLCEDEGLKGPNLFHEQGSTTSGQQGFREGQGLDLSFSSRSFVTPVLFLFFFVVDS